MSDVWLVRLLVHTGQQKRSSSTAHALRHDSQRRQRIVLPGERGVGTSIRRCAHSRLSQHVAPTAARRPDSGTSPRSRHAIACSFFPRTYYRARNRIKALPPASPEGRLWKTDQLSARGTAQHVEITSIEGHHRPDRSTSSRPQHIFLVLSQLLRQLAQKFSQAIPSSVALSLPLSLLAGHYLVPTGIHRLNCHAFAVRPLR